MQDHLIHIYVFPLQGAYLPDSETGRETDINTSVSVIRIRLDVGEDSLMIFT